MSDDYRSLLLRAALLEKAIEDDAAQRTSQREADAAKATKPEPKPAVEPKPEPIAESARMQTLRAVIADALTDLIPFTF